MRAVLQRVSQARVAVAGETVGACGAGLLILLGVARDDTERQAEALAAKIAGLRVFEDAEGKLNLSLPQTGGQALVVSNFTLYGDCSKGRRPDFARAAGFGTAQPLYLAFVRALENAGVPCRTGRFGADMQVSLVNDGPVTVIIDTDTLFIPQ